MKSNQRRFAVAKKAIQSKLTEIKTKSCITRDNCEHSFSARGEHSKRDCIEITGDAIVFPAQTPAVWISHALCCSVHGAREHGTNKVDMRPGVNKGQRKFNQFLSIMIWFDTKKVFVATSKAFLNAMKTRLPTVVTRRWVGNEPNFIVRHVHK